MKKHSIGILGGSFNPVHSGHMMLASYMAQFGPVDKVILMLSPCNPLKQGDVLAPDSVRYEMLKLACGTSESVIPSDYELSLPRPSYTINTLDRLQDEYPDYDFKLIIGSDNWSIFHKWRAAEEILSRFGVIVYPRPGYPVDGISDERVQMVDAPVIEISSTFIRDGIASGHDMNFFLPESVYHYIRNNNLYKS